MLDFVTDENSRLWSFMPKMQVLCPSIIDKGLLFLALHMSLCEKSHMCDVDHFNIAENVIHGLFRSKNLVLPVDLR
jgi:hypothetical protein